MAGLFDTFTVAKRGLTVQQGNINTASHNIANAQTEGYSRQKANVVTTKPFGGTSKFDIGNYGQVGTGAQINQINRIRNEFIDYQVRTETTNNGTLNSTYTYLYQVEDILNETTNNGIQDALNEFYDAFQELSKAPEKDSNKTVALKKAEALATSISTKYNQLENKKSDAQKELSTTVSVVNDILDQINELNKQISRVSAIGMQPNDLLDTRDYLIDQLSEKFGVKIDKQNNNTIDITSSEGGTDVGILVNSNPNGEYNRFSYVSNVEYQYEDDGKTIKGLKVTYDKLGDTNSQDTFTIDAADLKQGETLDSIKKQLEEDRILVANQNGEVNGADYKIFNKEQCNITKGEIAGNQQVQDNIQGYMDELDKFTMSFVYAVNAIQTGSVKDGKTTIDGVNATESALIFVVKNEDGTLPDQKTDTGISAKNIAINTDIENNLSLLNCGLKQTDSQSGEKDGSRALAIAQLKSLKINIGSIDLDNTTSREEFFKTAGIEFEAGSNMNLVNKTGNGVTLSTYYSSIISKLATTTSSTKTLLSTQSTLLSNLENQRLSESGVSLDEEMSDLIQFQHSYQANAKMINTVDELLNVVINGLKS